MKCPVCGCEKFFVKDPDDEYESYEIELKEGQVAFCDPGEAGELEIVSDTEAFCDKCVWHGKLQELKKQT